MVTGSPGGRPVNTHAMTGGLLAVTTAGLQLGISPVINGVEVGEVACSNGLVVALACGESLAAGRLKTPAARAMPPPAITIAPRLAASTAKRILRQRGRALTAIVGSVTTVVGAASLNDPSRAAANSPADAWRSSGVLAIAFASTASVAGLTVGSAALARGSGSRMCLSITATGVSPGNGIRPVSISYATAPSA